MLWGLSQMGKEKDTPMPESAAEGFRELVRREVGKYGWEDALTACNQALAIEPESTQFLLLRARAYDRGDMHKKALADCNRVIAIEPSNAIAHLYRGTVRIESKNLRAALEDVERAARLKPQCLANPGWLYTLSFHEQELKLIPEEETLAIVDRICAAAPEIGECHLLRSIVSNAYGHQDAAATEYKKAFEVGLSSATKKYFSEDSREVEQEGR